MTLTLTEIRQQLEQLINATPTGEARNALCDANISLMQAGDLLSKPGDYLLTRPLLRNAIQAASAKTDLLGFTRRACDALKQHAGDKE